MPAMKFPKKPKNTSNNGRSARFGFTLEMTSTAMDDAILHLQQGARRIQQIHFHAQMPALQSNPGVADVRRSQARQHFGGFARFTRRQQDRRVPDDGVVELKFHAWLGGYACGHSRSEFAATVLVPK